MPNKSKSDKIISGQWVDETANRKMVGGMRAAIERVEGVIVSSLDWDEVLDVLSQEVVRAGIFRSLTVGVVHWDKHHIEIVRNFLSVSKNGEINPSSEEIAAGEVAVVESGPLVGRCIPLDEDDFMVLTALRRQIQTFGFITGCGDARSAKMAYFIPVMYGDKVTAVIATGSEIKDQDEMMQCIESLSPLLKQVALALEHARLYRTLQERNREMEDRDRLLLSLQKSERAILASLNRDDILDNLAREITAVGIFESLMVALVDRERHEVEVVRSYVCRIENGRSVPIISPSESIGIRYDLDDENITAEVARTGRMQVIEEWDDRFDQNVDTPTARKGRAAYFVPVKNGDETVAIMATASPIKEKDTMLRRIDVMQPLLGQIALALERARLYEQLAAERERLSVTLASVGDGVIATDPQGHITLMNNLAESITGWKNDDAIGLSLTKVLGDGEDRRKVVDELLTASLENQTNIPLQMEFISSDGERLLVRVIGAPIDMGDEGIGGAVFVLQDITQLQKSEAETSRMQRINSLGVLAGGIAHDFNNILASALINASLLKMQSGESGLGAKIIADIELALQSARGLTHQLMTVTKGKAPVKEAASLSDLVSDSATFVLRGSNVKCVFDIGIGLWPAKIDRTQISQVLQNLIINADQAMPEGGQLRIVVENVALDASTILPLRSGRYIHCSVVDKGQGIRREHLGQVFDPYFTTKEEGTGLGLASSFAIISNHDGWMTVDSVDGEGAQFDFYLPAATTEVLREDVQHKGVSYSGGRVLLMDDDENLCEAAQRASGYLGYELVTVGDGDEAVAFYKKELEMGNPFDVVVLDLTIPGGMGGQEAARRLLELDPEAGLVVSSGYSTSPVLVNCRAHGFMDQIIKPYTMDELGQVLARVLS
ncbi:MAG: PAS domain S-box-containing protein [Candidatus Latescibacterota bacterium]|jgi:PAS domain S-box-containing protein